MIFDPNLEYGWSSKSKVWFLSRPEYGSPSKSKVWF